MSSNHTHNLQDIMDDPHYKTWVDSGFTAHASYWNQWKADHPEKVRELDMALEISAMIQKGVLTDTDDLWQRIEKSLPKNTQTSPNIKWLYMIAAAAACFIFFWTAPQWFSHDMKIEAHATAVSHELPDGSRVILNKETQMSYDIKEFTSKRIIHLSGEAYFEVAHGSSFQVLTDQGTVEVLGTSFNVFCRSHRFEVTCITGSVGVTPQLTQKREILSPGEKIWAPDSKSFVVQDEWNEPLWTTGSYYYQNSDLSAVLEELARQFQLELVLETSVDGRKYSGVFTDSDMTSAVYSVCWPMKLHCEVVGSKLIISEK